MQLAVKGIVFLCLIKPCEILGCVIHHTSISLFQLCITFSYLSLLKFNYLSQEGNKLANLAVKFTKESSQFPFVQVSVIRDDKTHRIYNLFIPEKKKKTVFYPLHLYDTLKILAYLLTYTLKNYYHTSRMKFYNLYLDIL